MIKIKVEKMFLSPIIKYLRQCTIPDHRSNGHYKKIRINFYLLLHIPSFLFRRGFLRKIFSIENFFFNFHHRKLYSRINYYNNCLYILFTYCRI